MKGTKVYVYYNLHKSCWSIKDYKTNKVIAHVDSIKLENVEFRVRQDGRKRVLQEQRKNVHAFVIGNVVSFNQSYRSHKKGVFYFPYKYPSFMDSKTVQPIFEAKSAILNNKRKVSYK